MARQIFRPFQREARGSGIPGLGLGLFIAAEIARAHEADLDFESTPEGTRFFLRLPVAELQETRVGSL
jgi:signal transduction histidine kinase